MIAETNNITTTPENPSSVIKGISTILSGEVVSSPYLLFYEGFTDKECITFYKEVYLNKIGGEIKVIKEKEIESAKNHLGFVYLLQEDQEEELFDEYERWAIKDCKKRLNKNNIFQDDLKIDVIYDKENSRLSDIIAWENEDERVQFLKMPEKDRYTGRVGG